jgi:hypothetical protein
MSSETSSQSSLLPRLLGDWTLVSYLHHPIASPTDVTYPHGPNPRGTLMYTSTGHMSAQVVTPGQAPFSDGSGVSPQTTGSAADWEQVGRNFIAYSGRFWVKDERTIVHEMAVCNVPRMVGFVQERTARFEDVDGTEELCLGVDSVEVEGVARKVHVRWRRMEDNVGALVALRS